MRRLLRSSPREPPRVGRVRGDVDHLGTPYLLIKVAVDDGVPPGVLAFVRLVMAATVLLALAWRAGLLDSLAGRWSWLVIYAVCELALPFPLIAAGEQHVDSSVAAIVIATAPLLVTLLAL